MKDLCMSSALLSKNENKVVLVVIYDINKIDFWSNKLLYFFKWLRITFNNFDPLLKEDREVPHF